MINDRNLTSHTYDFGICDEILERLEMSYFQAFENLNQFFIKEESTTMKEFGLSKDELNMLRIIFGKHLKNQGVVLIYGSRVKGTYTDRSDIDLVIKDSHLNRFELQNIIEEIDESTLPYLCDVYSMGYSDQRGSQRPYQP